MTARPSGPELTVLYRIPSGSNAVYRCVDADGASWVYKPTAGERPLADFPRGDLAAREIAAYAVSVASGWDLVPETVFAHGPGGPGMAQRWVDEIDREGHPGHDPIDVHPVSEVPRGRAVVLRGEGARGEDVVVAHATDERLQRIALLDHLLNNADRKGGHVLVDTSGQIWAIDHGLAFHTEPKLRTVLWGWAGQPVPATDLTGLIRVRDGLVAGGALRAALTEWLSTAEIAALSTRASELVAGGVFPVPGPGYPLPWPLF